MITVCCESKTWHTNVVCGDNKDSVIITAGGMCNLQL
jgi:hypothetical protein